MEKLLQEWRENAEAAADANYRFVRWTKLISGSRVDRFAKEAHEAAFQKIDCTRCANCCRTRKPAFSGPDIARISAHLGMKKADFTHEFLEENEEGELEMNRLPCAFLSETGHCNIYEVRPKACREFPNTQKTGFSQRSIAHSDNTLTCPATYHILELMKQRLGFRDWG